MEMRSRENTPMAQDLIAPVPPFAASLHDRFLHSRCSSCFRRLRKYENTPPVPIACTACDASISYCCLHCYESDIDLHSSSGECHLIRLLGELDPSAWHPGDSSDVRAALRLLCSLEALGLLGSSSPGRIGWLSSKDLDAVLGEASESEVGDRIRQCAALMRQARNGEGGGREEEALWSVITNAVEVQVSEDGALGIGVYGPWFSWFNHSCSPNACYRFELASLSTTESLDSCDSSLFRVLPSSNGDLHQAWKTWVYGGSYLTQGLCGYGPRIVVRSIKPIKQGEQVCIAYTDLLQPKSMRHFNLWCKYQFICSCERCSATPEIYVDYVLNSDARRLVAHHDNSRGPESDKLAEILDQTITEYMSDGSPEQCRRKLENMLSGIFEDPTSREQFELTYMLHPLHYLSLNAYIVLSSACRILSTNFLPIGSGEESTLKAFKMGRAAAAYSLLLAGATHHLFMSEPSLIASTAIFLVGAGESIIGLLRSSCELEFKLALQDSQFSVEEVSYVTLDELREASVRFVKSVSKKLTKSWAYLVQGLRYLENIRSPVDFGWLGIANIGRIDGREVTSDCYLCYECKTKNKACLQEHRTLAQVALCCLDYGRYLAIICWGQQSYLVDKVGNLLHAIR